MQISKPHLEVNKVLQQDKKNRAPPLCIDWKRVCLQGRPHTYLGNHIEISLKKNFEESFKQPHVRLALTALSQPG